MARMCRQAFLGVFFFIPLVLMGNSDYPLVQLKRIAVSQIPETLIIPNLGSVCVDQKGNVFAFAGRNGGGECFIVKFDPDLHFLKRFGSEGKGPGTFTTSVSTIKNRLSIAGNGDVYVYDANPCRLVVFDNFGTYKKDIPLTKQYAETIGRVYNPAIVDDGLFIGLHPRKSQQPLGLLFTLSPPEIKISHVFTGKRIRNGFSRVASIYYGDNCIMNAGDKYVVIGHPQEYTFRVYDGEARLKLKIEDPVHKMGQFTSAEMTYIKKRFFTPQSGFSQFHNKRLRQLLADKPRFNRIIGEIESAKNVMVDIKLSGGRVYLFRVPVDITETGKWPVDIYVVNTGKLIRRVTFKEIPECIWKTYAFFLTRDKDDNPLLLKYEIR